MVNLLLSLSCWIAATLTGKPELYLLTAAVFLLGFAMAVVTGMLLKILSFLIWLHMQSLNEALQAGGKPGFIVPKMKRVIADRKSDLLLISLCAAQLCIFSAILFPRQMTFLAAVAWLEFFIVLGLILYGAVFRYYKIIREYKGNRQHE